MTPHDPPSESPPVVVTGSGHLDVRFTHIQVEVEDCGDPHTSSWLSKVDVRASVGQVFPAVMDTNLTCSEQEFSSSGSEVCMTISPSTIDLVDSLVHFLWSG